MFFKIDDWLIKMVGALLESVGVRPKTAVHFGMGLVVLCTIARLYYFFSYADAVIFPIEALLLVFAQAGMFIGDSGPWGAFARVTISASALWLTVVFALVPSWIHGLNGCDTLAFMVTLCAAALPPRPPRRRRAKASYRTQMQA